MQLISEASNYRSLNSKRDLIGLIKEKNNKWTIKELSNLSKNQLFCIFANIDFNFIKKEGEIE